MKVEAVDGETLGDCPFCNGQIAFSRDGGGVPNGMIHSLPLCEKFEQLDALSFARECRIALQKQSRGEKL